MTELQAERGEGLSAPPIEVKSKRLRYIDLMIAIAAFAVLASLPFLFSSKALLDFVIRCAAFGLFATSLNLLVGYTGMISPESVAADGAFDKPMTKEDVLAAATPFLA